jgi:nucleotide-binding universal stress UspA family protein
MTPRSKAAIRHIACAVRGRLANRNATQCAIDLSLEHDARLTFFLVISSDFLASAAPTMSPTKTLYVRLRELGEYMLMLLRDAAIQRGVVEVEHEVRIGDVRENLLDFAAQTTAQILVMGRPSGQEPRSIFSPDEFDLFVKELERVGDLSVEVIDPVRPDD